MLGKADSWISTTEENICGFVCAFRSIERERWCCKSDHFRLRALFLIVCFFPDSPGWSNGRTQSLWVKSIKQSYWSKLFSIYFRSLEQSSPCIALNLSPLTFSQKNRKTSVPARDVQRRICTAPTFRSCLCRDLLPRRWHQLRHCLRWSRSQSSGQVYAIKHLLCE